MIIYVQFKYAGRGDWMKHRIPKGSVSHVIFEASDLQAARDAFGRWWSNRNRIAPSIFFALLHVQGFDYRPKVIDADGRLSSESFVELWKWNAEEGIS